MVKRGNNCHSEPGSGGCTAHKSGQRIFHVLQVVIAEWAEERRVHSLYVSLQPQWVLLVSLWERQYNECFGIYSVTCEGSIYHAGHKWLNPITIMAVACSAALGAQKDRCRRDCEEEEKMPNLTTKRADRNLRVSHRLERDLNQLIFISFASHTLIMHTRALIAILDAAFDVKPNERPNP